ncbi:exopolysaccharide biosynthesis protein [Carnobacterium maltaromaticum]|uniref:CpsD/CapB family tyrosine-protein kinase n=1 Tax=Carnobacterium maltaromaticum TaxID=2751 RepID=UPI000704F599|nr:CpsD/CapB family tyrosine-protein kinase [Carnobacterium maltaromaticum]KRN85860.1 polysaccharide biosynthesis protein, chain length determination [Carnobacterium maltaromaticum]MBC9810690.1 polysaccharide biosynthesis tyrosine autokinase [Carnobacterium maltaromaticum]TFJ24176.1 exopolysaccharide biosynthesis protein [Carnobacterium maltaromaticum]TFJ29581.1 exopolysaccharide biosynthesis protein [Carnobacterium maltaromaticum]TFJ32719.1 exopolysaccharide biosynthesis protein [Carnobacteri
MFKFKTNKEQLIESQKNGASLVTVTKPNSVVAEQFRTIRTNIQFSMIDRDLKSLIFTSSGPGEGKSTTSANLAVVFATQGKRVLLVDADMRKPSVNKTFKLSNHEGLTTLLTEKEVVLGDVVHETNTENLFILTCGPIPPNPSELLDSKKMNRVIEILEETFDLVIFDMPPIVSVTDAQIMASKTDGTVFVIRNGIATKEAVLKAKQLLDIVNANVVGTIFNALEKRKVKAYKYYGIEGEN